MITIGSVANSTEPNTDVSQSPRSGLRQRWICLTPGGGCRSRPRHSRRGTRSRRRRRLLVAFVVHRHRSISHRQLGGECPICGRERYQFVRMKLFSARAPTTLRASHQRCDCGGKQGRRRGQPDRERQPDAFCFGLAQHAQVGAHDRQQRAEHQQVQAGAFCGWRRCRMPGRCLPRCRARSRTPPTRSWPTTSTGTAGRWRCPANSVPAQGDSRRTTRSRTAKNTADDEPRPSAAAGTNVRSAARQSTAAISTASARNAISARP